jgi:hypothetical protein
MGYFDWERQYWSSLGQVFGAGIPNGAEPPYRDEAGRWRLTYRVRGSSADLAMDYLEALSPNGTIVETDGPVCEGEEWHAGRTLIVSHEWVHE